MKYSPVRQAPLALLSLEVQQHQSITTRPTTTKSRIRIRTTRPYRYHYLDCASCFTAHSGVLEIVPFVYMTQGLVGVRP